MELHYNLQLFAGEKTEKATPKRLREAREKGQVVQSKDINSALVLLFTFLTINLISKYWYNTILDFFNVFSTYTKNYEEIFTLSNITKIFNETIFTILKLSIPIFIVPMTIGILSSYLQVGFVMTGETLKVKIDRINPINGFKRLFSLKSVVELLKSSIKTIALIYITSKYLLKEYKNIVNVINLDLLNIIKYLWKLIFNLVLRSSILLIFLAILDYIYQRWEYNKELMMTKEEVKEEFKETEGDPLVRSKIREKQRQISLRRMMQDVPKADVVITNPTHIAVALLYDQDQDEAPKVIAKGKELIAENIKKIAKENGIPIIENKPLARSLYENVDIGEYIPPELYQAVAEILAYVYSLKNS